MSTWGHIPEMVLVPDSINRPPAPRVAAEKMLQFEQVLDAADAGVSVAFAARKRRREADSPCAIGNVSTRRVSLSLGESDDDEEASDTTIARALIKAIAASTGVEAPAKLSTARAAVAWASKSIVDARTTAVACTRREKYTHALDPDQTVRAMSLIDSLSSLLAGARNPSPPSFTPREHDQTLPQSSGHATG